MLHLFLFWSLEPGPGSAAVRGLSATAFLGRAAGCEHPCYSICTKEQLPIYYLFCSICGCTCRNSEEGVC